MFNSPMRAYGTYRDFDLHNQEMAMLNPRPVSKMSNRIAIFLILNAVMIGLLMSMGVVMHSCMKEQHLLLNKLHSQQMNMQTTALKVESDSGKVNAFDIVPEHGLIDTKHTSVSEVEIPNAMDMATNALADLPASILPSKYAAKYVTPHKSQMRRGTCWDFATISYLEWSYRNQGAKQGFMSEDEYVAFSEQAYGSHIVKLCSGEESSPQQTVCRVAGDEIWNNSTEGGESSMLFYLEDGLKSAVLPESVCPYISLAGPNETYCEGIDSAISENPIQFAMRKMDTFYDDMTVKRQLVKQNVALDLSTSLASMNHYYPCIDEYYDEKHCSPKSCTLCPSDYAPTTCCVPVFSMKALNIDGEFLHGHGMSYLGGHGMLMVGYNDAFLTLDGFTGGFILKNSWADGNTQGSHSIAYWTQDISDWEERIICPNSNNPLNWYACGNALLNATNSTPPNMNPSFTPCLQEKVKMFAKINKQPLTLHCADSTQCRTDPEYMYYTKNSTDYGDKMMQLCVWEFNNKTNEVSDKCLKPNRLEGLATVLIPNESYPNDNDRCGFYFMPYETLRSYNTRFKGFRVHSFDMEWSNSSYLVNKASYPQYNYTLLKESTRKQAQNEFKGPFPFADVVNFSQ